MYIDYIEYLLKTNPLRYKALLDSIRAQDPQAYAALVKAGIYQPLKIEKRLMNAMEASIGTLADVISGKSGLSNAVNYAEKTLVEYMKQDRFLPADVLGSKTSTLPEQVVNYSNTRLGQWSKMEDAKIAKTRKQLQAALSGTPVLNAASTAATRVGGPVLDVIIGALDPQVFAGVSAIAGAEMIPGSVT